MTGEGWQLSREALDRLLEALGPNREEASLRYEALRARLIDLFTWEADPRSRAPGGCDVESPGAARA